MIRCPNCSSVLPELESQGLVKCPHCHSELAPTGLPPLPGFDLETQAPATRSPTIFGLTSVGSEDSMVTPPLSMESVPGAPRGAKRSATAPLPGLPSVEDEISMPEIANLEPPGPALQPQPKTETQPNPIVDFSHDEESGLPSLGDLPALGVDLPGAAPEGGDLPGIAAELPGLAADLPALAEDLPGPAADLPSPSADLPSPTLDLPSPTVDLPSPSVDLPALSGSLPASMSSSIPSSAKAASGDPVLRTQTPPPPPGSARYQRPGSAQRAATPIQGSSPRAPRNPRAPASAALRKPQQDARAKLKRALARNVEADEDFLPRIEELDLDLAPMADPSTPEPIAPAANAGAVLPEDLPETVAALDLSELSMPGESLPMSLPSSAPGQPNAPSPAPRAVESDRKRWPLFAGAGLGVLMLAGVAGWQLGYLDQFSQPETSGALASSLELPGSNEQESSSNLPATPVKSLKPRSKPFIAALYSDNARNARTLAIAEKDRLGEIEANLYLAVQDPAPASRQHAWSGKALRDLAGWKSNPAVYVQRVIGLGQLYQGDLKGAEKTFAQAAKAPGADNDALFSLYKTILTHEQNNPRKSVEQARALAVRTPELKRAELLAQTWSQGLPPFAGIRPNVAAWEGLVAQAVSGDAPESHAYNVALTLFDLGSWAKAQKISATYRARAKDPEQGQRWDLLSSRVMQSQGQISASRQALTEVIEKDANSAGAYSLLWDSLFAAERYKELDESLAKRLKAVPTDLQGRIMQARSLGAQGEGSIALLLLSQIDNHLIAKAPLPAVLSTQAINPAFKAMRDKANAAPAPALMKISPKLSGVSGPQQRYAAASALARAEILTRRMAVKAANLAFEAAIELNPESTEAPVMQSNMLVKAGQFPRALAVLEGAGAGIANHASARANRVRAELLAHQATLARQTGKSKLARRRMAQAQAVDPQNPRIELSRAKLLMQHGKEREAEARFAALAERTGDMPGLIAPLAQIYLRRGELDRLDQIISPQLKGSEASLDMLISGARLRIAQNQLMPALALATRALKEAPRNWEAHLVKAQVLVARGDLKGALAELQQFKPKEPSPKYELWLGKIKDAQGDLAGAYGHYRLASSLDKSSVEPRVLQAKILARKGSAKKAISMLKPIMKRSKGNPDVFLAMGIAHRDLRKPKKAVAFFKRAQARAPGSYVAFYEEGRIASNHNRHAQVIRSMDRALAANAPAMPARTRLDALRRLGRAYVETKDFSRAEEVLSRYLIEAPRDDPGRGAVMRMMESL